MEQVAIAGLRVIACECYGPVGVSIDLFSPAVRVSNRERETDVFLAHCIAANSVLSTILRRLVRDAEVSELLCRHLTRCSLVRLMLLMISIEFLRNSRSNCREENYLLEG